MCRLAMWVLGSVALAGAAAGDAQRATIRSSGSSATQPVSPTTLVTWVADHDQQSDRVLDLLVVWRGTPGWFLGDVDRDSYGGTFGMWRATLEYGGVRLELQLDKVSRTAHIQGQPIALGDANVILADRVDTDGPVVIERLRIDPAFAGSGPNVYPLLRRSEKIVAFIQCDMRLPDPKIQKMFDFICAQITAKGISATR